MYWNEETMDNLPAEVEESLRNKSLNTRLVTWCTDTTLTSLFAALWRIRSGQLQTFSLQSGWTPNTVATRLSGTGACAQAARRTNT